MIQHQYQANQLVTPDTQRPTTTSVPVDPFDWQKLGLDCQPSLFFGFSPLDPASIAFQLDAIKSIAWIQPKTIGFKQWDLGLPAEVVPLCDSAKQERLFQPLYEPKHPRVFQLDSGGICWVPRGFLGLLIPLHDKDIDITLISYRETSSCNHQWPTGQKLYLTQTGIKAKVRLKFAVMLFQLPRERPPPPPVMHHFGRV
ncbi:hypothetical protein BGZ63DRAFT_382438 [Mariannaea sp. PMI_226]|nr:hypothetical protein BGZ63DRAFT_382438 [Mariannaea sp. PMI_226]